MCDINETCANSNLTQHQSTTNRGFCRLSEAWFSSESDGAVYQTMRSPVSSVRSSILEQVRARCLKREKKCQLHITLIPHDGMSTIFYLRPGTPPRPPFLFLPFPTTPDNALFPARRAPPPLRAPSAPNNAVPNGI